MPFEETESLMKCPCSFRVGQVITLFGLSERSSGFSGTVPVIVYGAVDVGWTDYLGLGSRGPRIRENPSCLRGRRIGWTTCRFSTFVAVSLINWEDWVFTMTVWVFREFRCHEDGFTRRGLIGVAVHPPSRPIRGVVRTADGQGKESEKEGYSFILLPQESPKVFHKLFFGNNFSDLGVGSSDSSR